jgi:hypothetical protein
MMAIPTKIAPETIGLLNANGVDKRYPIREIIPFLFPFGKAFLRISLSWAFLSIAF